MIDDIVYNLFTSIYEIINKKNKQIIIVDECSKQSCKRHDAIGFRYLNWKGKLCRAPGSTCSVTEESQLTITHVSDSRRRIGRPYQSCTRSLSHNAVHLDRSTPVSPTCHTGAVRACKCRLLFL